LLDWNGHANLEFAASTYCVFYLYGYLFKGNKKVQLALNNIDDLHEKDEINIFLRGRMLTSMDAMWRIYGYQTYPSSQPYVTLIKPKLPFEVNMWVQEGKLSDLYVYFLRPNVLHNLTICQFYNMYDYRFKLDGARFRNYEPSGQITINDSCYFIQPTDGIKSFYIIKRLHPENVITRLNGIPPDAGEIYYVRFILREMAVKSFDDMLTYDGIRCQSFQEATYKRGLLQSDSEAVDTFQEARLYQSPNALRALFVLLTIQGFPTINIYNSEELKEAMYTDFCRGTSLESIRSAKEKLLEDLYDRFSRHNKDMTDFGLPKPINLSSELERELSQVEDTNFNALWLQELERETPNTEEMQIAFDEITRAIMIGETAFFCIRGVGGAGKTNFAKKVVNFTTQKN